MQCLVSWIKKEIAKIITWYTGSIVDCSSCSLLWGWCVPPKFHTLRSFFLTPLSSFTFILHCMIRWNCWRSPGVSCNQCSRISTNDDKVNEVKKPLIDFSLKAEDELSPDPCYWNNHCDVELSFSFCNHCVHKYFAWTEDLSHLYFRYYLALDRSTSLPSYQVRMGDVEEQEVQEGPVENAWALKVFTILGLRQMDKWQDKHQPLLRCLSSLKQTIPMAWLKRASLPPSFRSIGRSILEKSGHSYRFVLVKQCGY